MVTAVSLVKALFGEKGWLEAARARRQHAALVSAVERLRRDNAALRDRARRLREDPRAIEEVARRDLGLRRPDEVVVIIEDARPAGLGGALQAPRRPSDAR
jgi:cell division protein FtsB